MPFPPVPDQQKSPTTPRSREAPLPRCPPAAADHLRRSLAAFADGAQVQAVQRSDLPTGRGDALAQLGRFEHLDVGAEAEQLAVGVAEVREGDDRAAVD